MGEGLFQFKRLGIIGGGQLGKMIAQDAVKMGIEVVVLDPSSDSTFPAAPLSTKIITGSYHDKQAIQMLADNSDIITYELENISIEALTTLEQEGAIVYPKSSVLEIIQDKLKQKQFLNKHNIPTSRFVQCDNPSHKKLESFGYPLVQKLRVGGYDGRGVRCFRSKPSLEEILEGPSLLEECVQIKKELAIIVARSVTGDMAVFPTVEMVVSDSGNILDLLIAPSDITKEQDLVAKEIAKSIVSALDGVGVFGIELFLTESNQILVNEISPRPHNSGHYTIEACITSQYEQHIRAIMGWPLGDTGMHSPVVMINLLGQGKTGKPKISGLEKALAVSGVTVHLYGKPISSQGRKMGHVTILDHDKNTALEKARYIQKNLYIYGADNEQNH